MLGAYFVLTFTIPPVLAFWLWPRSAEADGWKVEAVMASASAFAGMKAIYGYFVLLLAHRDAELMEAEK
jgi:hypothetical protein